MNNIRLTEDEIKALQFRCLTDRRIATANNEIAALYSISFPKYLIVKDGIATLRYDERVEYEVARVRSIITAIIQTEYADLLIHTEL
jgi:hypothetical protein